MRRLKAVLLALDYLLNAIITGDPHATLSATSYLKSMSGKRRWVIMRNLINALFFWDKKDGKKHCQLSWLNEVQRGHFHSN